MFLDEVVSVKFNVQDFWHRYEWQSRGSTYDHGLYWCEGALPISNVMTDEEKRFFARFWGIHVTGFNPEPDPGARPNTEAYILQIPGSGLKNTAMTLSSIVNRVQSHIPKPYCQRVNTQTQQSECRFYLPDQLRTQANFGTHPAPSRDWLWYYPPRNDGMVNKYNCLIRVGRQPNTDVSPCMDTRAVIEYVVEYATKSEKMSSSYREMAKNFIPFVNERRPFQSMVTKLMNKLIGDRDHSAQEVMHHLLWLQLCHSSCTFVAVDLRLEDQHSYMYNTDHDGQVRRG